MRMKVIAVMLVSLLTMKSVRSQSDELLVLGQTGNLYLQHTVVAKENWYSVGRLYNVTPAALTAYNKVAMTQPLSIGQPLLIPLTPINFSQNNQKGAGESLVPLYYIVQEKEWLYRVSVNHNKVPIPNLEKWNNINKDQVRAGMHLIVGYLKVKTALSALATRTGGATAAAGGSGVKPVDGATSGAKPADGAASGVNGATSGANGGKAGNAGVKPAEGTAKTAGTGGVKPAPDKTLEAVTNPVDTRTTDVKATDSKATDSKTTDVKATDAVKSADGATKTVAGGAKPADGGATVTPVSPTGKSFNGGFFKTDFTDGGKSAEGAASIFKSSSGWQDGKYYALMNNVPVGTIVRVTTTASGKTVFVKVLGQLPDMKESAGLAIRISNAAASELGVGERFNVSLKY